MNSFALSIAPAGPRQAGRLATALLLAVILTVGGAAFAVRAHAASVELLAPRAGSTVYARTPETHVVLRQVWSQGVGPARVDTGGVKLDPVAVRQHEGQDYLHFRLPLKPGNNSFTITPGGQRVEIRYRPLQADLNINSLGKDAYLFHLDEQLPKSCANCHDLQKTVAIEPVGLVKQLSCVTCHKNVIDKSPWQHPTTVNRQCLTCHQQFVKPWRIGFPAAKTEDICLACHSNKKVWRQQKYIHGPMNAGGCILCHNPHGDNYRDQLWADGAVALCIACHSDKENLVDPKKPLPYVHGIIRGGGCIACHDAHAGDREFMLAKPINELCVGCHTGLSGVNRGHPVGGHPVAGPKERRRQGRELNCTSCHDPHGSTYKYLLIGDSRGGHVCIACHR
jgi:predicted CXXCH cytochrome family protein